MNQSILAGKLKPIKVAVPGHDLPAIVNPHQRQAPGMVGRLNGDHVPTSAAVSIINPLTR